MNFIKFSPLGYICTCTTTSPLFTCTEGQVEGVKDDRENTCFFFFFTITKGTKNDLSSKYKRTENWANYLGCKKNKWYIYLYFSEF